MMIAAMTGRPENLRALMPGSDLTATDLAGHNAFDLLLQVEAQNASPFNQEQWACLDLLALFEPRSEEMARMIGRAQPRHLPMWYDPERADQERHAIVSEREIRVLRATLAGEPATNGPARPRVRL